VNEPPGREVVDRAVVEGGDAVRDGELHAARSMVASTAATPPAVWRNRRRSIPTSRAASSARASALASIARSCCVGSSGTYSPFVAGVTPSGRRTSPSGSSSRRRGTRQRYAQQHHVEYASGVGPPFVDWALATEPERYTKRLSSTMDELQAFYDAALPRLEDAAAYLEQLPLNALPDDAMRLLHLCYSLINVSFPIEAWRQPRLPTAALPRSTWRSSRQSDARLAARAACSHAMQRAGSRSLAGRCCTDVSGWLGPASSNRRFCESR